MSGIKITYLDPDDLMIISDGNQSDGKAATYLDLDLPPPYPINSNLRRKLQQAINSLPSQQKQVIKLILKGLTNREIANHLKINSKQVATQKLNAIKRLKKIKS